MSTGSANVVVPARVGRAGGPSGDSTLLADGCENGVSLSLRERVGTGPLRRVVDRGVSNSAIGDCASGGSDGVPDGPDVEYEPVCGPPVLTTTPAFVGGVVPDRVDTVLDGDPDRSAAVEGVDTDAAPSLDVGESVDDASVDDDSDPDGPDGSADATA